MFILSSLSKQLLVTLYVRLFQDRANWNACMWPSGVQVVPSLYIYVYTLLHNSAHSHALCISLCKTMQLTYWLVCMVDMLKHAEMHTKSRYPLHVYSTAAYTVIVCTIELFTLTRWLVHAVVLHLLLLLILRFEYA